MCCFLECFSFCVQTSGSEANRSSKSNVMHWNGSSTQFSASFTLLSPPCSHRAVNRLPLVVVVVFFHWWSGWTRGVLFACLASLLILFSEMLRWRPLVFISRPRKHFLRKWCTRECSVNVEPATSAWRVVNRVWRWCDRCNVTVREINLNGRRLLWDSVHLSCVN